MATKKMCNENRCRLVKRLNRKLFGFIQASCKNQLSQV